MKDKKITVIGPGEMAKVIISGLVDKDFSGQNICVSGHNKEKLKYFKEELHVNVTSNNMEAIAQADIIILAVKPKDLASLCFELSGAAHLGNTTIVSIAAGIRVEQLRRWLGGGVNVIRAMPNTPAAIHKGATALYCESNTVVEKMAEIESIFRSIGLVVSVEQENQLDVVTAISGGGPAYYFLLTEILEEIAIDLGLEQETARLLTLQTAYGAACLAMQSNMSIKKLRHAVTSPKGTTEAALKVMTEKGMRTIIRQAIDAAVMRANELNATYLDNSE